MTKQTKTAQKKLAQATTDQQTFFEHLLELRHRLIVVSVTLLLCCTAGYFVHDRVARLLLAPLHGERLIYLNPAGGFEFVFRITLYFGIAACMPVAIYEMYRYLAPLMPRAQTRRFALLIVVFSCMLAGGGLAFGYFIALPQAMSFMLTFARQYVSAELTASSYLNFAILYSLGFAIIFQLPIVMVIINMTNGPISPSKLFKFERWVLLGAILIAVFGPAPPDVPDQIMAIVPIVAVYQIGVGAVLLQNKYRKPRMRSSGQFAPKAFGNPTPAAAPNMERTAPALTAIHPRRPTAAIHSTAPLQPKQAIARPISINVDSTNSNHRTREIHRQPVRRVMITPLPPRGHLSIDGMIPPNRRSFSSEAP